MKNVRRLAFRAVFCLLVGQTGISPYAFAEETGSGLSARLQPFVDSHTLAGAVMLVANKDNVLATETVATRTWRLASQCGLKTCFGSPR
jgi:hypothetical protein